MSRARDYADRLDRLREHTTLTKQGEDLLQDVRRLLLSSPPHEDLAMRLRVIAASVLREARALEGRSDVEYRRQWDAEARDRYQQARGQDGRRGA